MRENLLSVCRRNVDEMFKMEANCNCSEKTQRDRERERGSGREKDGRREVTAGALRQ